MEDKKIQAETGSINNNQRGHDRGKDREEVLLNDKQQTEINGGDVTCEEWRHRLLSLLLRRAATYKVSTGNVFIHKAVPFFCVLKKVTNAVIPTLKKSHSPTPPADRRMPFKTTRRRKTGSN